MLDLESHLGQGIQRFCGNGFHAANLNHCAHYVSHACGLEIGYDCKQHTGGSGSAASIRVQEIFPHCPLVGHWRDANTDRTQLIFVTHASNVDLDRKTMRNVPKKHLGIYSEGWIYHYSNGRDQVVRQRFEDFRDTFTATYGPGLGFFFGLVPGSSLHLDVDFDGDVEADRDPAFTFEKDDRRFFATANGQDRFYLGKRVSYNGRFGLLQESIRLEGARFRAADWETEIDHWAQLLELSGHCESENYFCRINTYDSARFTFGFYQLAAHTPDDNLILFLRALVETEEGQQYFPELALRDGRLHRIDGDGSEEDLEFVDQGDWRLERLMAYLNPSSDEVEDQELLHCARLIYLTETSEAARRLQVHIATDILTRKCFEHYHTRYDLDGMPDYLVAAICDIHHQGRARVSLVKGALSSNDPLDALLHVNHHQWHNRNDQLADKIQEMRDEGRLGRKVYSAVQNEFVEGA